ncbi:MAG: xanthine phosphoribosyltransferase [Pseudomonadota bacterium]
MQRHKHFYVSWEELHRDTRTLAARLLPASQWRGVIAISRGGLIPAAIIARELNLRLVDTICVASYDYTQQGAIELLKNVVGDHDGESMLLVDDLVDTGATATFVRDLVPKARFVTVYAKPAGRDTVDDFIEEVGQDTWINFPWDMALERNIPLVDQVAETESTSL